MSLCTGKWINHYFCNHTEKYDLRETDNMKEQEKMGWAGACLLCLLAWLDCNPVGESFYELSHIELITC